MLTIRIRRSTLAVVCALVLSGFGLVSVGVAGGRMTAAPTAVAVVNMGDVLKDLDQRKAIVDEMQRMGAEYETDRKSRADALTAAQASLRSFTESLTANGGGTDAERADLRRRQDQFRRDTLAFEVWNKRNGDSFGREASLRLRALYQAIRTEAAQQAQAGGYDLVLLDDSGLEMPIDNAVGVTEQQVLEVMQRQRVLFAGRQIDITTDLITRMNNAFRAGR